MQHLHFDERNTGVRDEIKCLHSLRRRMPRDLERKSGVREEVNTGLFEMIVGVLTTYPTQYTCDRIIYIYIYIYT